MLRVVTRCIFKPHPPASLPLSLSYSLSYSLSPSFALFPQAEVRAMGSVAAAATLAAPTAVPDGKLELRSYQRECIDSVLSSLKKGHRRMGISLATGSGKTVIFTQLIDRISSRPNGGDRTLILAHRRELVEQAARHCRLAHPEKSIEVEMGSLQASGTADITIASVQSITSKGRLEKFDPSFYKLVLVDEAHHIVAPGYLKTLKHFGLDSKQTDSPTLVGVSATFARFDGLRLGAAIDEIVYHKDYVDMISDNWLSDVIFTTVQSSANLSKVKKGAFGDFHVGDLSKAVNTDKVNRTTVQAWMTRASQRKSTLVFCVDLNHVFGLTNMFRKYGYDAHYVTGETAQIERGRVLESFKQGNFPVLVNCGVFTEGTDIPNVDCILLARPTRSRNLLVQMIGRGMRLHQDKKNCHVIDLVSSLDTGIVTTPTLFGLDPSELVDRFSVDDMRQLKLRQEGKTDDADSMSSGQTALQDSDSSKTITFTDYPSVLDLISDSSGDQYVRAISPNAWVQVGPQRFILSTQDNSYLRIERIDDEVKTNDAGEGADEARTTHDTTSPPTQAVETKPLFRAVELRSFGNIGPRKRTVYAAPRQILTAASFIDAVHGADSFAKDHFPRNLICAHMPWRSYPASPGQLKFLNLLEVDADKKLTPKTLNKGTAADMITKLKHGARGQFARLQLRKRRHQQKELKEAAMRAREHVRVGPIEH